MPGLRNAARAAATRMRAASPSSSSSVSAQSDASAGFTLQDAAAEEEQEDASMSSGDGRASSPSAPPTAGEESDEEVIAVASSSSSSKRAKIASGSAAVTPSKTTKKRVTKKSNASVASSFAFLSATSSTSAALPPLRRHVEAYHASLLVRNEAKREALLTWYAGVALNRAMPWRKAWIDPATYTDEAKLREQLKRRSYEVWISEIMLQQTRVETVKTYYVSWLAKWPTIEALASASTDEVLAAWKGLGYYSRATRLQGAARDIVADRECRGLLPMTPKELCDKVQGVGPYTAGAISAIAFGVAAPMVDGNVIRVISRQIGLYASSKVSSTAALVTQVATQLVEAVALKDEQGKTKRSERPGLWGQALMELGATVCKPRPECDACPVSSTCRAYAEGEALAIKAGLLKPEQAVHRGIDQEVEDIEDLCGICEPLPEPEEKAAPATGTGKKAATKSSKKEDLKQQKLSFGGGAAKQSTLPFGGSTSKQPEITASSSRSGQYKPSAAALEIIVEHASLYPMKVAKTAPRDEECVVCVIQTKKGEVLLHQRPDKGLLASMWEFPAEIRDTGKCDGKSEAKRVLESATSKRDRDAEAPVYGGYHGSVTHLFSHIRLVMHVHSWTLPDRCDVGVRQRWSANLDEESISTGNTRCWELISASTKPSSSKRKR